VLLAGGERAGLLTNGDELRLLLCDPARPDSHVTIPLAGATGWRARNLAPDSYRVLLALAAPNGLAALADVLDAARLSQTRITKDLRLQARNAIEGFLQAVLDHPANGRLRADCDGLATRLWEEGLILVYRLLFVLKLETASDPARAFSFASTSLWRNALSPNRALGPLVRRHLDQGSDTGRMLEDGLRLIFRVFQDGLSCSELSQKNHLTRAKNVFIGDDRSGDRSCCEAPNEPLFSRRRSGSRRGRALPSDRVAARQVAPPSRSPTARSPAGFRGQHEHPSRKVYDREAGRSACRCGPQRPAWAGCSGSR